jgi:hypothetical protein
MSYTIHKADGSVLLTLGDSKVDQKNTSISLIGKNVPSYGEHFNNNLVSMLENFASIDEPRSPLVGQLWYDIASGRMKVYDQNSVFRPITNALYGEVKPIELAPGDLFFNTVDQQLSFTVDGQNLYNIGPKDSAIYGNTGWIAETIIADDGHNHVINSLYNGNQLIGVLSTSSFSNTTNNYNIKNVEVGLTLNPSIPGIRFIGTATSADQIAGIDPTHFVRDNLAIQTINGQLIIKSNQGFMVQNTLGENIGIYVDPVTHVGILSYNSQSKDFRIRVNAPNVGLKTVMHTNVVNSYQGIWTENPAYPLDINGNTRIQGNLIVQGSTTNLSTTNLQINDKNIELGYSVNSDSGVDGGGITLHGSSDHTVLWNNDGTGWNFNDNVNLETTASFYHINGVPVLSSTSLGDGITDAPSLVKIGSLTSLTITNVLIYGSKIQSTGTQTLYLSGIGAGTIDASYNRITSVSTATSNLDAANKGYVDDNIFLASSKNYALTLDVTHFPEEFGDVTLGVQNYLNLMFPIYNNLGEEKFNIPADVRAKVLCAQVSIPTITSSTVALNLGGIDVDRGGVQFGATVARRDQGANSAWLPIQTWYPRTVYTVQTWKVQVGSGDPEHPYVWTRIS